MNGQEHESRPAPFTGPRSERRRGQVSENPHGDGAGEDLAVLDGRRHLAIAHRRGANRVASNREEAPGAVPAMEISSAPPREVESVMLAKPLEIQDERITRSPHKSDDEMQEAFERIRMLTGTAISVRVSRKNQDGKWAFITGSMRFNPGKEDPVAIEERIANQYGAGDYLISFVPPKGSRAEVINYELSVADQAGKGNQLQPSATGTGQYSGVLTDLARSLEILNSPQNQANAETRQAIESLGSIVRDLLRKQSSEQRYERRPEEPPPYEYQGDDPEIRSMKDSMSRMERLMDRFLEAQMTPRKDDGGMKDAIKAIGDMMTPILTPLMTAMTAPKAAPAQGTTVSEVIQVIKELKGKEEAPKDPNSKLLETVLALVGTQGRDQLDMLLRGFDMGKKGEMSADALADLREDKEPPGIADKLLGLGEKFAEALGSSVGSKIGDAAANFATTGSPVPAAPSMAGTPAIRVPGSRMNVPANDQALVTRQPPPPPPHPAHEKARAHTPPPPASVQPAPHIQGGPKPAQFQRPGPGHPPPPVAPMGIPPELSQGFVNALSSDETPESIAAKTMMMINAIASNPEAAPGMGAFLESFKLPLDEGLAKLMPMMVPSHFERIVAMRPKVEKTYAEIQKLVGAAGAP